MRERSSTTLAGVYLICSSLLFDLRKNPSISTLGARRPDRKITKVVPGEHHGRELSEMIYSIARGSEEVTKSHSAPRPDSPIRDIVNSYATYVDGPGVPQPTKKPGPTR